MNDAPISTDPRLQVYEAETARLKALTEFLSYNFVVGKAPAEVKQAWAETIVEVYRAVSLIAQSGPPIAFDDDLDEIDGVPLEPIDAGPAT